MSMSNHNNSKHVTWEDVKDLANRAEVNGQGSISGILHCLVGAIMIDQEKYMFSLLAPFIFHVQDVVKKMGEAGKN